MNPYVIALDQGTTSSRAIVFDCMGGVAAIAQHPLPQIYPKPGWVEHDPMLILQTQLQSLREAFEQSGLTPGDIAAIGIANQRETTIVWDRNTGRPVCNAVVWQCRRTADYCGELAARGLEPLIRERTGLLIDPYFSGTKLRWILKNVPGAEKRAKNGELLFGTVETWLIWNLTGGKVHVTDCSNASRTMVFNIDRLCWDEDLCRELELPMDMLPTPVPNSAEYGRVAPGIPGLEALAGIPVCGAAGDQQAALLGQGCIRAGDAKNTYGTGCFTVMNTGEKSVRSENGLVSGVAWHLPEKTYRCLEGSVFNAGSTIQWLRDELKLISSAAETEALSFSVPDNGDVYLVPAFTGLGSPYWDSYARGTLVGLTRGSSRAHVARAALESIGYQVRDLIAAMERDAGFPLPALRVDGGASVNRFLMQFQADILQKPIDRHRMVETTAFGAAFLAGLAAGVWNELEDVAKLRQTDTVFIPRMEPEAAEKLCTRWEKAVLRSRSWAEE